MSVKIVNRQPRVTADISAQRHVQLRELRTLLLYALAALLAIYFGIGAVVDFGVRYISYEREVELFRHAKFSAFMAAEESATDSESLQRLKPILARLTQSAEVPQLPYTLFVLDDPEVNAFAFPGGAIGVSAGLLEIVQDDIEMAFVLAHELGHFKHRDHLHGIGRALGIGVLYTLIFGGQVGSDSLTPVLMSVLQGAYSRGQETAADEFGLKIVYEQYGTTEGFDRLFRFLATHQDSPKWVHMFSTHPAPEDRIDRLQTYIKTLR